MLLTQPVPGLSLFAECVDFDQLQAYDVADLLKQYFRELPECLLTNKLSETFIASFTREYHTTP